MLAVVGYDRVDNSSKIFYRYVQAHSRKSQSSTIFLLIFECSGIFCNGKCPKISNTKKYLFFLYF